MVNSDTRPRVGDIISVKNGKSSAIAVVSAREVLIGLDDEAAYLFGERQKSLLGINWLTLFYRVAIEVKPGTVEWFDGNEVVDVMRRSW